MNALLLTTWIIVMCYGFCLRACLDLEPLCCKETGVSIGGYFFDGTELSVFISSTGHCAQC